MQKLNSEFVTLNRTINKDSINVDAERLTNLNNSISESLKNNLVSADILAEVKHSDHCPIVAEFKF